MHAQNPNSRGFTLLEVVVALAVMSLCVTAVLQSFLSVTSGTRIAGNYYHALQIAETRMALVLAEKTPTQSDAGEVNSTYRWQTRVDEFVPANEDPLSVLSPFETLNNALVPYHYHVQVSWGDRKQRTVELSTIRLGAEL